MSSGDPTRDLDAARQPGDPPLSIAARRNLIRALSGLALMALLGWALYGSEFSATGLVQGARRAGPFLRETFPPDWTVMPRALALLLVTVQMAIVGTILGFVIALPVSFIAARTDAVPRPISVAVKQLLNVMRAVPPFIYAILFVYMVGLGPFPGALGIAVGSFVMLAKLFAETLESVHPAPVEAVKAVGGNTAQVFAYGMLPQALPQFLSHTMYAWELNISAATIMGVVGAGGIGQELVSQIHYFAWRQVSTYVLVLVAMVLLADALSYQVRKRVT
jgi:phosphonate transport system permease protein